jgi:cysteine desulfurase
MNERIYLDNNASTPLDSEVKNVLVQTLETFGNPSSLHEEGRKAKAILNTARALIAEKLKVKPSEIIFTSGGAESMNTLINGVLGRHSSGHIITSTVEHACVAETLRKLETQGFTVTYLNPGLYGAVTLQQVKDAIQPDTRLITLMAANNETGVITAIEAIGELAAQRQIPFVVDGVCALGKTNVAITAGISGMGFSAHKFHAPKGIGFIYVSAKTSFKPLIIGGEQEQGRRGGTVAVPLVAAMAKAIELLSLVHMAKMKEMRDLFEKLLQERVPGVLVNGEGPRICNTSNLYFDGVEGEVLLQKLDTKGIACSHGSACSSGALEPSKVLLGMGYTKERAGSSVRFSFSRMNTVEEVYRAVELISSNV